MKIHGKKNTCNKSHSSRPPCFCSYSIIFFNFNFSSLSLSPISHSFWHSKPMNNQDTSIVRQLVFTPADNDSAHVHLRLDDRGRHTR